MGYSWVFVGYSHPGSRLIAANRPSAAALARFSMLEKPAALERFSTLVSPVLAWSFALSTSLSVSVRALSLTNTQSVGNAPLTCMCIRQLRSKLAGSLGNVSAPLATTSPDQIFMAKWRWINNPIFAQFDWEAVKATLSLSVHFDNARLWQRLVSWWIL